MFAFALTLAVLQTGAPLPESAPLELSADTRVAPGSYVRAFGERGAIVIADQHGVVLDLTGVELRGAPRGTARDGLAAFGVVVRDSSDVTIRGGTLGGFKACVVALRTRGLVLDGLACDDFYAMRLRSTPQAEDERDWLYPHENDHGEWLAKYGAAFALTDSPGAAVKNCRARRGQNGLLVVRSDGAQVSDNDFSFLSGWGLALYRTSDCKVGHNAFDYCVRGFADGAYWRGQDSAAILLFERCSRNVFACNTGTHSGDGVFLYAGQDTVAGRAFERGEEGAGGSDRNIWYRNDFSFAVANGIEATFSRDNAAIENRLNGCHQHGVWGGYSREFTLARNEIHGTLGGAISIEHGQQLAIVGNSLRENETGLELWWDEDKELIDGPFGKHRDTSSRDAFVARNTFAGNAKDLVLRKTERVKFGENTWSARVDALELSGATEVAADGAANVALTRERARELLDVPQTAHVRGTIEASSIARASEKELAPLAQLDAWTCPEVPGTKNPFAARAEHTQRGLDAIVMGEWGPWDFVSGEPRPAQRALGGLLANAKWSARWFNWKATEDPRTALETWRALAASAEAKLEGVPNFAEPYAGNGSVRRFVGANHFGLIASTKLTVTAAGQHRLRVRSDDGVRVMLDGKVVLENWTWHAPTNDEAVFEVTAGEHTLALEYFQIDGAYALGLELDRVE